MRDVGRSNLPGRSNNLLARRQTQRLLCAIFPHRDAQRDLRMGRSQATIELMMFAVFAMRVLEVMFFFGLAGSAVVVLISFVEDGKELFGRE